MKIYTKKGDDGTSTLTGGTRVYKDDIRMEAYGTIDELNSYIGLLISEWDDLKDVHFLTELQHHLFKAGSLLAQVQEGKNQANLASFSFNEQTISSLEAEIDRIQEQLPEMKLFILPGGNRAASICHITRTVCRRAERLTVSVSHKYAVDQAVLSFLNRLSDYLFVLARKMCLSNGQEIYWDRTK
jgi:cob(I)alamin adenosyltransferase